MSGPASVAPPVSSPAKKPAGPSLKKQWDLKDPQLGQVGSSEQAKKFAADFKAAMQPVNSCLQYTKSNAVKEKHDAMVAKRDYQYTNFQSVQSEIDPKDESKAKDKIAQYLASTQAVANEANQLKEQTEKSVKAWEAKEPEFDKAISQLEEMEKFGLKPTDLRKLETEIRNAVNDHKFDDAVARLAQLTTNVQPAYDDYKKQKEAKEYREKKWNELKPRVDKLFAEPPLGNARQELEAAIKVMDQAVAKPDWLAAKARVDELATRLEQHEKLYEQRKADKKVYEEKSAQLKPQLDKIAGEVLVEGSASEKTKTALGAVGKAKTDMQGFATAGQYDKAKETVEKLPGLLEAYDKAKKEDKAHIRWFKPKFSVAETAIDLDLNAEKEVLVQFENAADLSPEAKFKFELEGGPGAAPAGAITPIKVTVETKQSTGVYRVKSLGVGSQTFKFKVTAEQGKDTANWPVAQSTTVKVKKPEMVVTADTAKKYRPNDTTAVRIEFKNVNKAKEVFDKGMTCTMEADSMRSLDRGMTDSGNSASFKDPWFKEKESWENDNTFVVGMKADHAGTAKLQIVAAALALGAGGVGEPLKQDVTFACVSTLEQFLKELNGISAAQGKITGRITSFFAAISAKAKEAKSNFDKTYAEDTSPEKTSLGDKAMDAVWDKGKDALGTVGKVIGLVEKVTVGDAPKLVAAALTAMSKEQLGATLTIKAGAYNRIKPTIGNLSDLGNLLVGALQETMADTIKAWQNWAKTAKPDKDITFDPSDGLYQACTIGGVRLVDLPLDTLAPDDYERELWKQWVAANQDYFKKHGADLTRGREGANTKIIARLIYLRVDFPKNLSRF
jgi:hypothetical protein